jgi:enamine deaminase RidA (YjgF/YER057c/UK114 family)
MNATRCAVAITISVLAFGCVARSSPNQAINPEGLFKYPGFHQVMVSSRGKTIYVAGQVAQDAGMNVVGEGDYRAQTLRALRNVAIALEAAGATPADVVSSTFYIKGLRPKVAGEVMQAMAVALDGDPFPAHAFNIIDVEMLGDPRLLIEITAIATIE